MHGGRSRRRRRRETKRSRRRESAWRRVRDRSRDSRQRTRARESIRRGKDARAALQRRISCALTSSGGSSGSCCVDAASLVDAGRRLDVVAPCAGRRVVEVLAEDGATFAGTHWPSLVRCAGTTTSPGAAEAASVAAASVQATVNERAFRISGLRQSGTNVSPRERRAEISLRVVFRAKCERDLPNPVFLLAVAHRWRRRHAGADERQRG